MTNKRVLLALFFFFAAIASVNTLAVSDILKSERPSEHDANSIYIFRKYAKENANERTAKQVSFAIEEAGMNKFGEVLLAQIALESSCLHWKKKGRLNGSKTGAQGLCQITPTTAFQKMKFEFNKEDWKLFMSVGGKKPDLLDMEYSTSIFGKKHLSRKNRKKIIDWLSSENNSIAFWITLMRKYEEQYGIDKALVAYAIGEGGLKKLNYPKRHVYVKKVMAIKKTVFDD